MLSNKDSGPTPEKNANTLIFDTAEASIVGEADEFQHAALILEQFTKTLSFGAQDEHREKNRSLLAISELNAVQREVFQYFCDRMSSKDTFEGLDNLNLFTKNATAEVEAAQVVAEAINLMPASSLVGSALTAGVTAYSEQKIEREKKGTTRARAVVGGMNQVSFSQVTKMVGLALIESCNHLFLMMDDAEQRNQLINYLIDVCIASAKERGEWNRLASPKELAEAILTSFYAIKDNGTEWQDTLARAIHIKNDKTVKIVEEKILIQLLLSQQFIKINNQLYARRKDNKIHLPKEISAKMYLRLLSMAREVTEGEALAITSSLNKKGKTGEGYIPVDEATVIQSLVQHGTDEDKAFFKKLDQERKAQESELSGGVKGVKKAKAKTKTKDALLNLVAPKPLQSFLAEGVLHAELERLKNVVEERKLAAENQVLDIRRKEIEVKNKQINELAKELQKLVRLTDVKSEKSRLIPANMSAQLRKSTLTLTTEQLLEIVSVYHAAIDDKDILSTYSLADLRLINQQLNGLKSAIILKSLDAAQESVSEFSKLKAFHPINKAQMHSEGFYELKKDYDSLISLLQKHLNNETELLVLAKNEMNKALGQKRTTVLLNLGQSEAEGLNQEEASYLQIVKAIEGRRTNVEQCLTTVDQSHRALDIANPTLVRTEDDLNAALVRIKAGRAVVKQTKEWADQQALHTSEQLLAQLSSIPKTKEVKVEQKPEIKQEVVGQNLEKQLKEDMALIDLSLSLASGQALALTNQIINNYGIQVYNQFVIAAAKPNAKNPGKTTDQQKDFEALREVNLFKKSMIKQKAVFTGFLEKNNFHENATAINKQSAMLCNAIVKHRDRKITVSDKPEAGVLNWFKRKIGWIKENPRKSIAFIAVTVATGGTVAKIAALHHIALGTLNIAVSLVAGGGAAAGVQGVERFLSGTHKSEEANAEVENKPLAEDKSSVKDEQSIVLASPGVRAKEKQNASINLRL